MRRERLGKEHSNLWPSPFTMVMQTMIISTEMLMLAKSSIIHVCFRNMRFIKILNSKRIFP